ncbi:MAG TPA: adenylyltransferase/cytidyltransferase family protein [Dermatophilaceae bacterium]|nr:adenylyltransferase/cytidyltransferase family protein [Dermatophilaceae bacterium]
MSIRGYVPGVFDMFHVGHLNIVRAARKECDYLIVGVVADEVVAAVKGRPPVVPLAERMEIVAALRDVDEVVVDDHADKFDAWQQIRYDVIFKGDDWRGTPKGAKLESDLASVGARIHYFPYTRHTSSTILRQALDDLVDPSTWPPEWAAVVAAAAEASELAHTSQGPA